MKPTNFCSDGAGSTRKSLGVRLGMVLVLTLFGVAEAQADQKAVRYSCEKSSDLTVERGPSAARVTLAGRTYALQRKQSSIGDKYVSSRAALIIDGPSVVFVSDDHLDIGACVQAVPVAAAR